MTQPEFAAFPTEFPREAAARIGRAIIAKEASIGLAEDAYDLVGYALGRLLSGRVKPTFGSPIAAYSDDDLATLLIDTAEPGDGFAATDDDGVGAIPWTLLLPILFRLIERVVAKK